MEATITVFGGTGFLGSRVVRHLLDAGCRVRVAARNPHRRADLPPSGQMELVRADLLDPASLQAATAGADAVVNATSLYLERGGLTFDAIHVDAAGRLARIAREEGCRRFVQLSGIGAAPDDTIHYLRARAAGETAVRNNHPGAIIVRPGAMFGADDALLSAILTTARRLPIYPLFGSGESRLQPVFVDDVAEAITAILHSETPSPCYELAGPAVYGYRALVEKVCEAAGVTVRPIPVPFALWHWLSAVTEHLPGAPLTRAQVALIERNNVATAGMPGLPELGVAPTDIVDHVRHTARATGNEGENRP